MPAKYQVIARELRSQILMAKSLKPYKLPTEQELCTIYHVSRQTIRQALHLLEEEKLISRRQGSGAYTIPQTEHLREQKIVLLISEENEYIYPKFISEVQTTLRHHNLLLTIRVTNNDINLERSVLQELVKDSVSVLLIEGIVSAFPNPNLDLYEQLQFSGTKLLFIGQSYPQLTNAVSILWDDIQGGYTLGKHLASTGCLNFAALLPTFEQSARLRYSGAQAAFRDDHLPMPSRNIFWYSEQELYALRNRHDTGFLAAFVQTAASKYDSVLCYSDEIAYWLIKELSYAGISVPEQISIVSFDNSYLCSLSSPSITSLSLPEQETVQLVCNNVLNFLHNKKTENKILPWKLYSRGSSK